VTDRSRLVLAAALMLFLELALIRWLGANIVHLSYFSNFVLMGSFLGIGLGLLRASAPGRGPRAMPLATRLREHARLGGFGRQGCSSSRGSTCRSNLSRKARGSLHIPDRRMHPPMTRRSIGGRSVVMCLGIW
jgi:hypothetical protein